MENSMRIFGLRRPGAASALAAGAATRVLAPVAPRVLARAVTCGVVLPGSLQRPRPAVRHHKPLWHGSWITPGTANCKDIVTLFPRIRISNLLALALAPLP